MRQIENYRKELSKILSDKATINQRLADKRKRRVEVVGKLQKEELMQAKKAEKQQKSIFAAYEQQMEELTKQITMQEHITENRKIISESGSEEYAVFISHETEDKESFSDEFVRILQEKFNLKVWYDAISIKWGDSIRTEIDKGLKKSKFGVVILSRSYVSKY